MNGTVIFLGESSRSIFPTTFPAEHVAAFLSFLRLPKCNREIGLAKERHCLISRSPNIPPMSGFGQLNRFHSPKTIRSFSLAFLLFDRQIVLASNKKRRHHVRLLPDAPYRTLDLLSQSDQKPDHACKKASVARKENQVADRSD